SLRSSSCSRLENSHHYFSQRSTSDSVCAGDDGGPGSKGPSEFFCFFGCWRSFSLGSVFEVSLQFGQPASIALNCRVSFWLQGLAGASRPFSPTRRMSRPSFSASPGLGVPSP